MLTQEEIDRLHEIGEQHLHELMGYSLERASGSDPDAEGSIPSAPAIDWDGMPGGMDNPIRG